MTAQLYDDGLGLRWIHGEEKSSDEPVVCEAGSTPVRVECPSRVSKQRADRERRLEALAVEVLTAPGERDGAVRSAEPPAAGSLLAMTNDEGLSVRDAVEWCGRGVTSREMTKAGAIPPRFSSDATAP